MVLCEQFIFTSSKLEDGGYQVISQSSGITSKILKVLEEYLYPIGIDPSEFVESKSMRILDDKITFIQSKNIGISFDGRPDTMYSHIIVMNKNDFKKFENDSRIFNENFIEKKHSGHLPPLSIDLTKLNPDFTCIDVIGIMKFQKCMKSIFKHKKIAIVNIKNQKLIQSIFSLVPPSFRLLSFSTLVPQPEIQTKFDIIQIFEQKKSALNKYEIIDTSENKLIHTENKTIFDVCFNYLIEEIIDKKNTEELKKIYDEFENIPISNVEEKLSLIIGSLLLEFDKAYSFKQEILKNMLTIIGKIPSSFSQKYWKQIRKLFPLEEHETYALEFEIEQIINEHKIEKITLGTLISMFYLLKNNNPKTRQVLLQKLFQMDPKKFLIDSTQLLMDTYYSAYRKEILDLYIEKEILNPAILTLFDKEQKLSHAERHSMYDEFVRKSYNINIKLTLELLSNPMYDFNDEYESRNFKHLLKESYENILLTEIIDKNQILEMVTSIFKKTKGVIEFKPKSGTEGTTEENLKQLIEIMKILQRFLNYTIEKTQDMEMKKRTEKLRIELEQFVIDHPIAEEKPKRWLFWDIFGIYDK